MLPLLLLLLLLSNLLVIVSNLVFPRTSVSDTEVRGNTQSLTKNTKLQTEIATHLNIDRSDDNSLDDREEVLDAGLASSCASR